jgi:hypothetical protein
MGISYDSRQDLLQEDSVKSMGLTTWIPLHVAKLPALRILLAIAAAEDLEIHQTVDVVTADPRSRGRDIHGAARRG